VSDVYILFRSPPKGIEQTNGIEIFPPGIVTDFFICAGFVEGIQIMTHHRLQLAFDTSEKPLVLEIIWFSVPAGIDIKIDEQIIIQQDVPGTIHPRITA
jgi:hypothetical protein